MEEFEFGADGGEGTVDLCWVRHFALVCDFRGTNWEFDYRFGNEVIVKQEKENDVEKYFCFPLSRSRKMTPPFHPAFIDVICGRIVGDLQRNRLSLVHSGASLLVNATISK